MITFTCDKGSVKIEGNASPKEMIPSVLSIVLCVAVLIEKDSNGGNPVKNKLKHLALKIRAMADEDFIECFTVTSTDNSSRK